MVDMWRVLKHIKFEKDVRHKNRFYLSDDVKSHIDWVVAMAKEHCSRTLEKSEALYRARIHPVENSETQVPYMWKYTPKPFGSDDLGAPPTHLGTAGRLNPPGIRCLYTASEERTAIAETRPWTGAYVSVAKMKLTRDVRLIDLRMVDAEPIKKKPSEQTEFEEFQSIWQSVVCLGFSIPCHRDDNSAYAPFQFLAAAFQHAGADGIAYSSSLDWSGYNVAIFKPGLATVDEISQRQVDGVAYTISDIETKSAKPDDDRPSPS